MSVLRPIVVRVAVICAIAALLLIIPSALVFAYTPPPQAPGEEPPPAPLAAEEAQARLVEGFRQILNFFSEREFSLLAAWREMRGSEDPDFFTHRYPAISNELDSWAQGLEARFGVAEQEEGGLDFTFLLREFAGAALDENADERTRDNALATICMVCAMDGLRCEPAAFHRFLGVIVADDISPLRQTEALRWWRRTDGFIDEGLLEEVLKSPGGEDIDLRLEAAKALFSIGTRRSLQAQKLLVSTSGLPEDPAGMLPQVACTAMRHFSRARYEESTPELLDALSDPSPEVRGCAAETLAVLSGQPQRFDPAGTTRANAAAVAAWRQWWAARSAALRSQAR